MGNGVLLFCFVGQRGYLPALWILSLYCFSSLFPLLCFSILRFCSFLPAPFIQSLSSQPLLLSPLYSRCLCPRPPSPFGLHRPEGHEDHSQTRRGNGCPPCVHNPCWRLILQGAP